MDDALARRLDAIERRLAALEGQDRADAGPLAEPPPITPVPATHVLPPTPGPVVPPALVVRLGLPFGDSVAGRPDVPHAPGAAAVSGPSPVASGEPDGFERTLGLKWAGWVGAVVLVIGAALGVKFAYDQGWLGGLPDAVRCGLLALAGVGLIGVGETVFRRVDRLAATGLYGAGVALLYLAAYAAQAWYGLLAPPTALVLMAGAASAGTAVAARAGLVSVAALALIGGGVCPAFFGRPPADAAGFLTYLLFLQSLAVGLCAWRATPPWWTLRGLSLAVTTAWAVDSATVAPAGVLLAFAVVFAAVYQAELVVTTRRRPAGVAGPAVGATFSLLVTAGLAAEWTVALRDGPPGPRAGVLAALAATAVLLAVLLRRGPTRALARGFEWQALLLVVLAVAVRFEGDGRLIGWMLLSAGLSVRAGVGRERAALGAAVGVWGLAVVAWGLGLMAGGDRVWFVVAGTPVVGHVAMAALLAVTGHAASAAWHRSGDDLRPATGLLDGLAALVFGIGLASGVPGPFATRAGLGYAWALVLASRVPGLRHLGPVGLTVLGVTAAKWTAVDVLLPVTGQGLAAGGRPFWNPQAATGVALAGSAAAAGRLVTRDRRGDAAALRRSDAGWQAAATVAFVLLGFTLTTRAAARVALSATAGYYQGWPAAAATQFYVTLIAAACLVAWAATLRSSLRTDAVRDDTRRAAALLALLLAAKFVAVDVFLPYASAGGARAAAGPDLQTVTAVGVVLAVGLLARAVAGAGGLAVLAVVLVTGSAEIDRYATRQASAPAWVVRQAGWSVYWAGVAVATLVVGLVGGRRELRLAALGVLAVTLLKATLVDLAGAGTGWRIVSFLALGALLLLTSVLYGRFHAARPAAGGG